MSEKNSLTIDVIISKFVPILGAILFVTGLGYLIYTSIWPAVPVTMRLGLGFFASFLIIGSGLSFSAKLKYFADVIIGAGILLFYGTLIYGSRTTDIATDPIIIPEAATLVTAFIITIAFSYFASLRKSLVIIALGLIGAYLTPFVIGQNDVWASNMSFNSYLVYFAMINAVIFVLGREIAIHKIVPLNLIGLFVGTYSIYALVFQDKIAENTSFLAGNNFAVLLMAILVILSVASLAYSSKFFTEKNQETTLTLGYIVPLIWFLMQLNIMDGADTTFKVIAYIGMAIVYFGGWHYLRPLEHTRYQHIGAYAGGVVAVIFAISNIFGKELNLYSGIVIAYIGLFFAIWNMFGGKEKGERILTAISLSAIGGIIALYLSYSDILFENIRAFTAIIGLIPAILLYFIAKQQKTTPQSVIDYLKVHSLIAGIFAIFILIIEFAFEIDFGFIFLIIPGLIMLLVSNFRDTEAKKSTDLTSIGLIFITFGFFSSFFWLVGNIVPHVADDYMLAGTNSIFSEWYFIKSLFALGGYFLAIHIFRKEKRFDATFPLITVAFATLLLIVNLLIIVTCNQIGIPKETGGIRAIGTTFWWIALAIILLIIGIRGGKIYKTEKLIGLILLLLTVGKIGLYDLATMPMDRRIIVLMVVGGMIMMFSYFLQVKGYLKDSDETTETKNP